MLETLLMGGNKKRSGYPYVYTTGRVGGVQHVKKLDAGFSEVWSVETDFVIEPSYILRYGEFIYVAGIRPTSDFRAGVDKRRVTDGGLEWAFTSSVSGGDYRTLAIAGDRVIAGGIYGPSVIGLIEYVDESTGAYRTRSFFSSSYYPVSSTAVGGDFVVGLIGSGANVIRYTSTRNQVWQSNNGRNSPLAYDPDLDKIFVGGGQVLNPSNGARLTDLNPPHSVAATDSEFFYCRNTTNTLQKVDKNTLQLIWDVSVGVSIFNTQIFVSEDGHIYLAESTALYCVSPTGNIVAQIDATELNVRQNRPRLCIDPGQYLYGGWS